MTKEKKLAELMGKFFAEASQILTAPVPAPKTGRPVLVTTSHGGVFFGYLEGVDAGETLRLKSARNIPYWSSDVKGFIGLAVTGPTASCRVGPAADILLKNVTSVTECTDTAVSAWEGSPWQK